MASITVNREDAKHTDWYPPLCAYCGKPAEHTRKRTLAWTPGWVYVLLLAMLLLAVGGLLVFIILHIVLTQKATVRLPFCTRHRNHWRTGDLLLYVGLGVMALLFIGTIAAAFVAFDISKNAGETVLLSGLLGCGGIFVAWIVLLVVAQRFTIRAGEINYLHVKIVGLSDEFCEAVEYAPSPEERKPLTFAEPEPLGEGEPRSLAPARPPPPLVQAVASADATKLCPFCSEEIKAAAVKCRFCGEFLD